jgi:hypothetical protein
LSGAQELASPCSSTHQVPCRSAGCFANLLPKAARFLSTVSKFWSISRLKLESQPFEKTACKTLKRWRPSRLWAMAEGSTPWLGLRPSRQTCAWCTAEAWSPSAGARCDCVVLFGTVQTCTCLSHLPHFVCRCTPSTFIIPQDIQPLPAAQLSAAGQLLH